MNGNTPSKPLVAGSILAGRYRIARPIGEGGMASVWEGEHLRLAQRVAIKVLHADLAQDGDIVARFEREGRAIAKLRTRHVVRVLDVDTTEDGAPFLVMERLEGRALDAELAELGPRPVGEAVSTIIEACAGVAEAHALGVVHRDIKPSNLFLAEENGARVVKVLDFGISRDPLDDNKRLTKTEAIMGTPLYMAPEQFRSTKDVDARADVWALGATLYEMLAGRAPFENAEGHVAVAIVSDPVPPIVERRPDVPAGLVIVIERALAKDRSERFATARELAEALAPFASHGSAPGAVSIRYSNSARPHAYTEAQGASPVSIRQSPSARPDAHTEMVAVASSKIGSSSVAGALMPAPSAGARTSSRSRGLAAAVVVALALAAGSAAVLRASHRETPLGSQPLATEPPPPAPIPSLVATASAAMTTTLPEPTAAAPSTTTSAPAAPAVVPASTPNPSVAKRPPPPQPPHAPPSSGVAPPPLFFPPPH